MQNAKITNTFLGKEDHGIFTYTITLDYGGTGQAFGQFALDGFSKEEKKRKGTAFGLEAIMRLLEVLHVGSWEQLVGTPCRVDACHEKIYRIGHYLDESWLDLKELTKEFN